MVKRVFLILCMIGFTTATSLLYEYNIDQIPEKIRSDGYVAEVHHVTTEDGYILEMHRIPFARNQTTGREDRPRVLLMHGILASSTTFLLVGVEYSIAYNLADAGFDVWLGNARGNRLSRRHISLDPDDRIEKFKFFDFTWEQMGTHDLVSMIDYVLLETLQQKLHYIGHSQGGTAFLVLTSMRPEYNSKFITVHLLSGVGYMEHLQTELLRKLAVVIDILYKVALKIGFVEFKPLQVMKWNDQLADACPEDSEEGDLCKLIDTFMGFINAPVPLFDVDPYGGGAVKQLAHYGQNLRDKKFRRWNFGAANVLKYGALTPPLYDLGLITANITMHYAEKDIFLDEEDVLAMAKVLPNSRVRKVAKEIFGHTGYTFSRDVKELVTDYIIEDMLYWDNK